MMGGCRALSAVMLGLLTLLAGCSQLSDGVPGIGAQQSEATSTLVRAGAAAESAGNYELALNAYTGAAKRDPKASEPRLAMARTLLRTGRTEEAETTFRAVLSERPGSSAALVGLGQTHLTRGEYEAALSAFEAPSAKGERLALIGSGVALDGLSRHGEAQALYRRVLADDPTDLAARNNLGLSLAFSGDYAGAVRALTPIASGSDATPRTRQNLSLAYALAGDLDAARRIGAIDLGEDEVEANLSSLTQHMASR